MEDTKQLKSLTSPDKRHLTCAEGFLELEMPDHAWAELQQVTRIGRRHFEWLAMTGEILKLRHCYTEAIDFLNSASLLKPEDVGTMLSLGWCYKRTNELSKAVQVLKSASRVCDRANGRVERSLHALVLYNLACYLSLAKDPLTVPNLLKAITMEPHFLDKVPLESDFDNFRKDPVFQAMLKTAGKLAKRQPGQNAG